MAKLILATVFCFFLLVKGTEAQAIGADCTDTCTDDTATCDTTCKIKAGETCTTVDTQSDCIEEAMCKGTTNLVCTCNDDHSASTDSTQCEAKVGIACDTNTPCVSGSTCDTTCKIKAGETCLADSTDCIAHAACDGNPLECTCGDGYTVNGDSTKCQAKVGIACDTNTPCVSGSTCDTTCKVNAGESCAGGLTCVTSATCDGTTCKIKANENCAAATTQCTAHAECDTTCKCSATYKAANGVCVGTKEVDDDCSNDNCIPGAICDGGKCKTKESTVNGSCSVASKAACDPDILACQSDKCKSKIGVDCVGTGDCVTGATCTQSKCSCSAGVVPSADKTQCGGAMGIAASMLLVVATFVTSRFL